MNYLAHLLLSTKEIDCQVGNLLADPLKGRLWEGASDMHQLGFKLHSIIDSYTDSHSVVSHSKSILKEKGYLKAVVVDVLYDHFLTKHWSLFTTINLEEFIWEFHRSANQIELRIPQDAKIFISKVIEHEVLSSYKDLQGVEQAFSRIDKRLSPRLRQKESMIEYVPLVESKYTELESDFLVFFPKLVSKVISCIDSESHYLSTSSSHGTSMVEGNIE